MDDELRQAREELDEEFRQLREDLREIHDALQSIDAAGPLDDVAEMLDELEGTVQKGRTGGLIGGGAKGHEQARRRYLELQGRRT